MTFILLILKNLGRNRIRTWLTAFAIAILATILTFVSAVTNVINDVVGAHSSQTKLIVRESWVIPSRFPIRYVDEIVRLDGILDWTVWHFYAGYLDTSTGTRGAGIATRIDNLKEMHDDLENLDPKLIAAMSKKRDGVLIGKLLTDQLGWQVGQRFTVTGITHPGKNLQFEIVGIIDSDVWGRNYFFREDYFQDGLDDREEVNLLWLRVADETSGTRIAAAIEKQFEKGSATLSVETESAGVARFIGRTDTIVAIINFVVVVLMINMVIVLSNSISMTVRERRSEMAILKILGFRPSFIVSAVVGEAVLVGVLAGFFGAFCAYGASQLNNADVLPMRVHFLTMFPVRPYSLAQGLLIGAFVGFVGSIIPARNAQQTKVDEAFSQVG